MKIIYIVCRNIGKHKWTGGTRALLAAAAGTETT